MLIYLARTFKGSVLNAYDTETSARKRVEEEALMNGGERTTFEWHAQQLFGKARTSQLHRLGWVDILTVIEG